MRVLVAEDNKLNQYVLREFLRDVEIEAIFVENGADAVRAHLATAFAIIVMDIEMPVLDGLAAIKEIRAAEAAGPGTSRARIIALTANAAPRHIEDCLAAGADAHLAKPLEQRALLEALELPPD